MRAASLASAALSAQWRGSASTTRCPCSSVVRGASRPSSIAATSFMRSLCRDADAAVEDAGAKGGLRICRRTGDDPSIQHAESRPVPRTGDHVALQGALVQWAALVCADCGDRVDLTAAPHEQDRVTVRIGPLHPAIGYVV